MTNAAIGALADRVSNLRFEVPATSELANLLADLRASKPEGALQKRGVAEMIEVTEKFLKDGEGCSLFQGVYSR